jgi:hypothetical protein
MADMMMPGTMAPEPPSPSMDQLAAFEQMRQQVSPTEVNRELLTSAEEVDPVAVADFRKELADLNVPPEVIDMLRTMVDEVLATPEDYPAIRQKYLAMGVDEELLPEAFDAALFAALNVALDELGSKMPEPMPMAPPQGFARGGIASLKPMAREMAAAGRYGDTMLAHISPVEAQILRRYGGSGTINPVTGAPEFFLKKMFKSIGKAVKKFASSTIGKIVIGTALFMVAGPAAASMLGASAGGAVAAGISGFVSGAGTTLLAGGNLKEALKAGAIGGVTAGVAKGVTNRLNAPSAAAEGATARPATVASAEGITRAPLEGMGTAAPAAPAAPAMPTVAPPPAPAATPIARAVESMTAPAQATPFTYTPPPLPQGVAALPTPPSGFFQNVKGALTPGDDVGFFEGMNRAFNPAQRSAAGLQNAEIAGQKAYAAEMARSSGLPNEMRISRALDAQKAAIAANTPRAISNWLPAIGAGLGIMALTGAAEEEPQTIPPGFEDFAQGISPGAQLLANEPQRYGLNFGGVQTLATPEAYNPYTFYAPPRRAAKGGSMEKHFPRKNGPINGPGTGTSDSIPAMLSDGEFVFTAKAVRGMGNGSRRAGAKKMYALMKKLEGRQNG